MYSQICVTTITVNFGTFFYPSSRNCATFAFTPKTSSPSSQNLCCGLSFCRLQRIVVCSVRSLVIGLFSSAGFQASCMFKHESIHSIFLFLKICYGMETAYCIYLFACDRHFGGIHLSPLMKDAVLSPYGFWCSCVFTSLGRHLE